MGIIKKYQTAIIGSIVLIFLYLVIRLVLLTNLPIFTDEAIYLRWAQIALNDPSWTFISLTDGKQPLFIWASMALMKFIHDPLMAGRLVSVFSGLATLIGLMVLTYELFKSKTTALLTGLLYVFFPFAQVYDRLALMDSMSASFYIWSIYLTVLLVRRVRLDVAFALGMTIAGGMLTKSTALFSIYILPFSLLLFDFKRNNSKNTFLKWVGFAILAAVMGEFFYNFLRLSPLFYMIEIKNHVFLYTYSEWFSHPFQGFLGNFKGLSIWFVEYFTVYIILILAAFLRWREFSKEKILLLLYFFIPYIGLAVLAKVIYPRYFYFNGLALLPLAGLGLTHISSFISKVIDKNNRLGTATLAVLTLIFIIYPAYVSYTFAANPWQARIAGTDRNQYISGWPSGWGVKEAVNFFNAQSKSGKIFVASQGTFGILPQALDIYLVSNKNITSKGYWPITPEIPQEILDMSAKMPTYVVFYQPCDACGGVGVPPSSWPLKQVLSVKKGDGVNFGVYQVE